MNVCILKAYKYRLYPNTEQQDFFAKSFGCARFVWNKMLNDKIEHYEKTKTTLKNTPAQYKKEFEWLKEVDRELAQSVCITSDGAQRAQSSLCIT